MKTTEIYILQLVSIVSIFGKILNKKIIEKNKEMEDYDADIFCKSANRLVKTEESDEIMVVDTFPGNSLLLECKYCDEKDRGHPKTWRKQRPIFTGNIMEFETSMENNFTASHAFVTKDHSLVLRNIQETDLGLYICSSPWENKPKNTFNYLLDFVDKNIEDFKGTIKNFKNYSQNYLEITEKIVSHETFPEDSDVHIKILTEWSNWSECDTYFSKEGIRFRRGKCRVKFFFRSGNESAVRRSNYMGFNSLRFNVVQSTDKPGNQENLNVADSLMVRKNVIRLGIALSCNSFLLRTIMPKVYNKTHGTPDFVLNEKCRLPFKRKSSRKGPRYRKSIILATGAHLTLVCPDSTIDSEVEWEHNGVTLKPNQGADYVVKTEEPRLYVDSFNTLYLFEVTDKESGNYTCFVDGLRMQEVRIIVLTRSVFFTKEFTRHLKYLGYLFALCFFAYLIGLVIAFVKIHSDKKAKKASGKDAKRLLSENRNYESDDSS